MITLKSCMNILGTEPAPYASVPSFQTIEQKQNYIAPIVHE